MTDLRARELRGEGKASLDAYNGCRYLRARDRAPDGPPPRVLQSRNCSATALKVNREAAYGINWKAKLVVQSSLPTK